MSSFNISALQDYSPDQLLKGTLLIQVVFVACYLISAVFLATNTYAGFNTLLLGVVILAVIGLSYYGLFKEVAAMIRYKNDVLGAAPSNEAVGSRDGIPVFTLPMGLRSYTAPVYNPVANPDLPADSNSGYPQTADL
eukprot:gene32622-39439_t